MPAQSHMGPAAQVEFFEEKKCRKSRDTVPLMRKESEHTRTLWCQQLVHIETVDYKLKYLLYTKNVIPGGWHEKKRVMH